MPKYFHQAQHLLDFFEKHNLKYDAEYPVIWLYHNEADQPLDPGGNPVREPFIFEAGQIMPPGTAEISEPSPEAGKLIIKPLRPLTVASVMYQGSYPHQRKSGFVEAWMTLVTTAEEMGYRLTHQLYRELYLLMDWKKPKNSITEIQVEITRDQGSKS